MLKVTQEQKLQFAKMLRDPGNLNFQPQDGYLDVIKTVETKEVSIPARDGYSIPCWLMIPQTKPETSMLYINIHGGGFVIGHSVFDSALCAVAANTLHCPVLDIDYRLAPEYPFPCGLNDCYDVLQWAVSHAQELGIDPQRIVVGGNSAGGTYAATTCMKAAENGTQMPAMLVMIYPACAVGDVDELPDTLDLTRLENRGLLFNICYLADSAQTKDPYASILCAPAEMLEKLPEAVVVTAGLDPLAPGGDLFASHLAASGQRVVLRKFKNSRHGFYIRCIGDEWQAARAFVFDEIKRKMNLGNL